MDTALWKHGSGMMMDPILDRTEASLYLDIKSWIGT